MLRRLFAALIIVGAALPCAHAGSTINTGLPATNAGLNSVVVRQLATAAASDINNLQGMFPGNSPPASPTVNQDWCIPGANPELCYKWDGANWNQTLTIDRVGHAVTPYFGNPVLAAQQLLSGGTLGTAGQCILSTGPSTPLQAAGCFNSSSLTATAPITAPITAGVANIGITLDSNFAVVSSKLTLASGASGAVLANCSTSGAEPALAALTGASCRDVIFNANAAALSAGLSGSVLHLGGVDTTPTRVQLDAFGAISAVSGAVYGGTNVSRTAVGSGVELIGLNSWVYNGSAMVGPIASFRLYTAEAISSGHQGSKACIGTTAIASTSLTDSFCQNSSGGITIGSPTGGDKGSGTLNAPALFINNVAVTAAGITALTGDGTATGPGSAALTLATVNANVGSFGSSTAIPNFTVNAKGLITAAGTSAVIAPAGTLSGTTLASGVTASSLTSVGTLAGLTVTGSFTATGLVTLADHATQGANTFLANVTSGTASPTAASLPSCTGAAAALQYTSGTGLSCATISASASAITVGSTTVGFGPGILYNSTSGGTLTAASLAASSVMVSSAGSVPSFSTTLPSALTIPSPTLSGTVAGSVTLSGSNTYSGTAVFSFTGAAPTLANGNASILASSSNGGIFTGKGTTNDFTIQNSSSAIVAQVPAGTQTLNVNTLTLTNQLAGSQVVVVGNASGSPSATFGVFKADGTTIQCTSGTCTAVGASATSIDAGGLTSVSSGTNGNVLIQSAGKVAEATPGNGIDVSGGTLEITAARRTLPTTQRFTSSSGTYTTSSNVLWIQVYLVGAGGGGSGGGSGAAGGGGSGGNTCWNTTGAACTTPFYQAGGGGGGSYSSSSGGQGGTISGTGTCNNSGAGGDGTPLLNINGNGNNTGAPGGNSSMGGGGAKSGPNAAGAAGAANTGGGGQGGGTTTSAGNFAGAGGGAGASCWFIINNPASTYTYAVGGAGGGGTPGTSGTAGGAGAAGNIYVEEHYN